MSDIVGPERTSTPVIVAASVAGVFGVASGLFGVGAVVFGAVADTVVQATPITRGIQGLTDTFVTSPDSTSPAVGSSWVLVGLGLLAVAAGVTAVAGAIAVLLRSSRVPLLLGSLGEVLLCLVGGFVGHPVVLLLGLFPLVAFVCAAGSASKEHLGV